MLGRKTAYLQPDNWTVFLDGEADGAERGPTEMSLTLARRGKIHLGCTRGYSSPASPGQTHTHTGFFIGPLTLHTASQVSQTVQTHTHRTLGITLFNPVYRVPDKYAKWEKKHVFFKITF